MMNTLVVVHYLPWVEWALIVLPMVGAIVAHAFISRKRK